MKKGQQAIFRRLKDTIWLSLGLFLAIFTVGCGSDEKPIESQQIAIQVNDSKISLEKFNELMKFEVSADPELDLTTESRNKFIEYLIYKELMIQEAVHRKIDRKKNFLHTIEKYWESTLIRNLLDQKSDEINRSVLITDEETKQYYDENKAYFDQPFANEKESIRNLLESRKTEAKLKEWTKELKASAKIHINKKAITQN